MNIVVLEVLITLQYTFHYKKTDSSEKNRPKTRQVGMETYCFKGKLIEKSHLVHVDYSRLFQKEWSGKIFLNK